MGRLKSVSDPSAHQKLHSSDYGANHRWSCVIADFALLQGAPNVSLTETAVTSYIPPSRVGWASAVATATTDTAAPILFSV